MMPHRGIQCPSLHVKNFVVMISGEPIPTCQQWADLPVKFSAFDYIEHASRLVDSSDDEDM